MDGFVEICLFNSAAQLEQLTQSLKAQAGLLAASFAS